MKFLLTCSLLLTLSHAMAAVECTNESKDKWKNEEAFKKELEQTYKIKKFKVTEGNCYEIYGHNKQGDRVEIYFNPVTGEIVKSKK